MSSTRQDTRYRDIRLLGSGGMATVTLAEDTKLSRLAALKRVHVTGDSRGLTRLRREALVGASLNHPSLVSVWSRTRWPWPTPSPRDPHPTSATSGRRRPPRSPPPAGAPAGNRSATGSALRPSRAEAGRPSRRPRGTTGGCGRGRAGRGARNRWQNARVAHGRLQRCSARAHRAGTTSRARHSSPASKSAAEAAGASTSNGTAASSAGQASASTGTGAVTADASPPSTSASAGAATPTGAVQSFYELAAHHDYAGAWQLADRTCATNWQGSPASSRRLASFAR